MGTFTYTHSLAYDNGGSPATQTAPGSSYSISDGEPDTSFELGDAFTDATLSGSYTFIGTMVVDGVEWPVFNYVDLPQFDVVFMDQAPVSIPPTLSVNSGNTYNIVCFAAGTRIATPDGERLVEDLSPGDRITTADGRVVTATWIGCKTLRSELAGQRMQPVRISAGALGAGVPHSDLTVTADHGMVLDGQVINASALVNSSTIDWVPMAELGPRYTVYHIETAAHDVILANGAASETYVDAAARNSFDNYATYLELLGADRIIPEMHLPRITSARMLPLDIQQRLSQAPAKDPTAQAV